MKDLNSRFHVPLVALWVTLSLAGVAVSWMTWRELADSVELGVRRAAMNDRLDGAFGALLNAETGERGFVITGKESYLTPLHEAETGFAREFEELTALAADDPVMIQHVVNLRGLAELRLNQIRGSISMRRERGFEAARASMDTDENRATMNDIRKLVERMRQERPNLLTAAGSRTRGQLRRASYTSLAAGLVGVGAGLFAFRLARLALRQEKRARVLLEGKLRAEQSNAQKTAFLANVSHEIRTPMNSILGFSELLEGEVHEGRQRHFIHSLRASAQSLLQLINDVLDMSKIEAGVMKLQPEPTDCRQICAFLRTLFVEQTTRRAIELTCEAADDLPRALLLDRIRLRQVLVNLAGNAVKFTRQGFVKVRMDWEEHEESAARITLLIDVEDSGCGIPREQLDAIFEPFVQANPARREEKEGTGLGLSIVRRLTEAMGGQVMVTSVVGQGTTFHLRFPNVQVSVRLPDPEEAGTVVPVDFNEFNPARILVVDDTATNRELLAGVFDGSHHDLHFARDGSEAVVRARELLPDVILMDVRMPILNGRDALKQIRDSPRLELTPVIAITASNPEADSAMASSFSGYVRKPFSRQALFDELSHFLRRRPRHEMEQVPDPHGRIEGGSPGGDLDGGSHNWPELLSKLRQLQDTRWPVVREGLSVKEARAFADDLRTLGRRYGWRPLQAHAATLIAHCDSYSIPELESSLDAFPAMVGDLERLAA